MPTEQKHIYSAKEIQRYHEGKMSSGERHAMEKAALEDPFLADAIEGYTYTTSPKADLTDLKTRMDKKQQKEKTIPVYHLNAKWLRIAALFLLLAGCGWLIYETALDNKSTNLAMTKKTDTTQNASPQTNPDQSENIKGESDTNTSSTATEVADQSTQTKEFKNRKKPLSTKRSQNQDHVAANKYLSSKETIPATVDSKAEISSEESAEPVRDMAARVYTPVAKNIIRGQVVNTHGSPLPFANILDQNNLVATTTDVNGKFSIAISDTTMKATIAAVGYQQGRLNLNPEIKTEQKVILKEADASLNEVVVTGMAAKRSRRDVAPSHLLEVSGLNPVKGWAHFNEYWTKNLKRPAEENNAKVTGEVWLSFSIDKNGKPINIQLEKSLCPACDKEAIRLLTEGPVWRGNKGKLGKVRIQF